MNARLKKWTSLVLTAVFAVLSTGNVSLHQLAGSHNCHCFDPVVDASSNHAGCCCGEHRTGGALKRENEHPVAGEHVDCAISGFYRQAQLPATVDDAESLEFRWTFNGVSNASVFCSVVPCAFWSRGPPVNC